MDYLQTTYKTTRQDRQMKNRERGRNKEISEPDGHHAHQNGGPANESKSQNNRENEANSNHFVSKISVTMGPNKSQNSVASKEGSIRDMYPLRHPRKGAKLAQQLTGS